MSLLLAAGIGATAGLTQTGIGLFNRKKGNDAYRKLMRNRPKFTMPESVNAAVNEASLAYRGGLPTYDLMEQGISATTSRGVSAAERSAGSGQELLGATEQMFARELESLNKLNVQDIQYRDAARRDYMNALLSKGQYEAQAQEQEFNIWQMKVNRAAERAGYGQQMVMQGIGGTIGSVGSYLTTKGQLSELRKMFPQQVVANEASGLVKWNNIDDSLYRGKTAIDLPTSSYYTWP